jgi:pimeloyl-ACP methyl ester carboxylesterase
VVARQEHQTADRLAEIARPTLILVGDRDTHVAGTGVHLEQSAYLAEHIRDAELRILEGVAHGYFWQAPELSARVVGAWTSRH